MTDVELVIKIPEDIYRRVVVSPRCATFLDASRDRDMFVKALQTGTPLPKGHGRLIDADDVTDFEGHYIVTNAPTIIEASEAESEE